MPCHAYPGFSGILPCGFYASCLSVFQWHKVHHMDLSFSQPHRYMIQCMLDCFTSCFVLHPNSCNSKITRIYITKICVYQCFCPIYNCHGPTVYDFHYGFAEYLLSCECCHSEEKLKYQVFDATSRPQEISNKFIDNIWIKEVISSYFAGTKHISWSLLMN